MTAFTLVMRDGARMDKCPDCGGNLREITIFTEFRMTETGVAEITETELECESCGKWFIDELDDQEIPF